MENNYFENKMKELEEWKNSTGFYPIPKIDWELLELHYRYKQKISNMTEEEKAIAPKFSIGARNR